MLIARRNAMRVGGGVRPYWGLTFTAEEAGSTVSMKKNGGTLTPAVSLETSMDNGRTWTPFVFGTTTITLANVGDSVCFRAGDGGTGGDGLNVAMAKSIFNCNSFVMSGRVAASGDMSSILDRSGTVLDLSGRGSDCFTGLFSGCTSLVSAPKLPATTLAGSCYKNMFRGCTSLVSAPELPATTLAASCYINMFHTCTSLTHVKVRFTEWAPSNATTSWLNGVAASGTFECPDGLDTTTRNATHVPEGWNVVILPDATQGELT